MSTHKYIDKLCAVALVLCLLLTIMFMNGESLGLQIAASASGYEARLFDTERVHTIDIVMDDWDSFIETCENEEYAQCAVVIDGEAYKSTGIRAKGNTSLSMVSSMESNRYSFKLEFDHYDSTRTYYGLDKLSLNNIIQDTTYMKDYLTYQLMGAFGVDAPLCSYVYITVNGEDWGLYLAVEGVEDAFLRRNYGSSFGELYKPDSTGFGGGRGNGKGFNMEDFDFSDQDDFTPPETLEFSRDNQPPEMPGVQGFGRDEGVPGGDRENKGNPGGGFGGGPGGGMGSDDVKLRYIDDDPDSYSNIFQNAKTDISEADQARLIAALKALSDHENLEDTLNIDEVLRYFVVHNFVCNGDSYTGSMVHNYYLYEEDGQLSMIPWDYNLAYGTFQGGDASSMVNSPIDTPVSGGDSRPMVDWIFDSPEYTELYHQYFQEFLETVDIDKIINHAAELIASYVEKDPTKFYSYAEFETGVDTLRTFCRLRTESVSGQLSGTIPSTTEGQAEDSASLISASSITLSDMGTMNHGGSPGDGEPRERGEKSGKPQMPGWDGISMDRTESEGQAVEVLQGSPPGQHGESSPMDENTPQRETIFPEGNNRGFPSPPSENPDAENGNSLALTGVSFGILLAGLGFAFLYQRRKH